MRLVGDAEQTMGSGSIAERLSDLRLALRGADVHADHVGDRNGKLARTAPTGLNRVVETIGNYRGLRQLRSEMDRGREGNGTSPSR